MPSDDHSGDEMERRHIVTIGVIAAVSLVLLALAFTGAGPLPSNDTDDDPGALPTETTPTDVQTPTGPIFSFDVERIENCGETCRDVTATLFNHRPQPATNVTVHTRIYAGENNTDSDDLVWSGETSVGTIEAEGAYTTTERVELSLLDAFKVQQRDYWITIVTVVESSETTITFRDTRQVD